MRTIPFGSVLWAALGAYLALPVSSAPTDARNDLTNEAATFKQEARPFVAGQQQQIRLSVGASEPPALCPDDAAASPLASSWVFDGVGTSNKLGNDELELQYLPPVEQRVWGEETYAIALNDSSLPDRWGRGLAAHPSLPYAVLTIGPTALVYRTGADWTLVRTLRDGAAASVEEVVFSPDGRRLGVTYREDYRARGDSTFTRGSYTRIFDFDRLVASSTDDDISDLVEGGPLQKARDVLLASLNDLLRTGAGWTDSEISTTDAVKTITKNMDLGMAKASLRRDAALHRALNASLFKHSFSPDNQLLFLKTQSNNISIHDISSATKPLLRTLSHPPLEDRESGRSRRWAGRPWDSFEEEITWIESSPTAPVVATISRDKTAILWNAVTGDKLLTLRGAAAGGSRGRFSPDGSWFAVASSDSKIFVYSTTTGKVLATLNVSNGAEGIAVSSDGSRLAVVAYGWTNDVEVVEFDTSAWTRTKTYTVPREPAKPCPPNQFCFDESRTYHIFSPHQEAELYYIHGGNLVFRSRRGISILGDEEREILRISARLDDAKASRGSFSRSKFVISPDGNEIWSFDDDDTFRVWKIEEASRK